MSKHKATIKPSNEMTRFELRILPTWFVAMIVANINDETEGTAGMNLAIEEWELRELGDVPYHN